MINHIIGRSYRYDNCKQKFLLEKVSGFVYWFKCGHWCTDCVFVDLIDCFTGIRVSDNNQMQIEFNTKRKQLNET